MRSSALTSIEFFGGLGVIGSSKIVIEHTAGGRSSRVQLDMGLDIPNGPVLEGSGDFLSVQLTMSAFTWAPMSGEAPTITSRQLSTSTPWQRP